MTGLAPWKCTRHVYPCACQPKSAPRPDVKSKRREAEDLLNQVAICFTMNARDSRVGYSIHMRNNQPSVLVTVPVERVEEYARLLQTHFPNPVVRCRIITG